MRVPGVTSSYGGAYGGGAYGSQRAASPADGASRETLVRAAAPARAALGAASAASFQRSGGEVRL
jgi:hypothetical protein